MKVNMWWRYVLVSVLVGLASGCATNLQAVRSYSLEVKKVSDAFEPMLEGSVDACIKHKSRKTFYTANNYDPAAAAKQAENLCKSIREQNAIVAELNQALAQYGSKLGEIAGEDVSESLSPNLGKLADSAGKLKDSKGQALVPSDKLSALSAFAKFLAQQLVAGAQRQAIKDALDHHDALVTLGNGLVRYAESNYSAYLEDDIRDIAIIEEFIKEQGKKEPFASRIFLRQLYEDKLVVEQKQKVVPQFKVAMQKMISVHEDLRNNVDKLEDKERLKQIMELGKEVRELNKQLQKAF